MGGGSSEDGLQGRDEWSSEAEEPIPGFPEPFNDGFGFFPSMNSCLLSTAFMSIMSLGVVGVFGWVVRRVKRSS